VESGEYKQVGKSCLKDFLGHQNPEHYAAWAESLWKLDADLGSYEDEDLWGEHDSDLRYHMIDLESYLSWTVHVINNFGWVSKGKAYETMTSSTADQVSSLMFDNNSYVNEVIGKIGKPGEKEYKEAREAIEWASQINPETNNDYLFNLYVACSEKAFEWKDMGLVASLIATYRREMGKVQERKAAQESNYFGEIKKRSDYMLKLTKVRGFDGNYGMSYMHQFIDNNGNIAIWWTSTNDLDTDTWYEVKGTVKEHKDYNGIKQTVLTRCNCQMMEEN